MTRRCEKDGIAEGIGRNGLDRLSHGEDTGCMPEAAAPTSDLKRQNAVSSSGVEVYAIASRRESDLQ